MEADFSLIEEYPFTGTFSRSTIDETAPLASRTETMTVILETVCDIQEATRSDVRGVVNDSFNVFFPFDKATGVTIRRGDRFDGNMYGVAVKGEVDGIFPTQLGGCEVHLKDFTV